jgi:hypothetical protein
VDGAVVTLPHGTTFMAADVNGDGFADMVAYTLNYTLVALSTGNGTFLPFQTWMPTPFDSLLGEPLQTFLADVNGDGLADLVGSLGTDTFVATSGGTSFNLPSLWQTDSGGLTALADVNGDGFADALFYGPINLVSLSMPSGKSWQPGNTGWFYFWNLFENAVTEYSEVQGQNISVEGTSAEWIMEEPALPTDVLANYGSTSMSGAYAEDFSGATHTMATDAFANITMKDGSDVLSTAVIAADGQGVTYTWHNYD